jgi:adenylate cyclase class 2
MREIEIKARLNQPIEDFIKSLDAKGVELGGQLVQHDVVYGHPDGIENGAKTNWLRIRTENQNKIYFTLKRSVVGHLDSIEHEVIVDNAEELESIFKELGYELHSDLTKVRRKAKVGDLEICVDSVEGLGDFVEVEKLCLPDVDNKTVVKELWDFLFSFGVSKDAEVHEGYDVLERKKRGLR